MDWRDWETDNDWIAETLEVHPALWEMAYPNDLSDFGHLNITPAFEHWCQNNLSGHWEIGSGTISVSCMTDATLLRLYMGGG